MLLPSWAPRGLAGSVLVRHLELGSSSDQFVQHMTCDCAVELASETRIQIDVAEQRGVWNAHVAAHLGDEEAEPWSEPHDAGLKHLAHKVVLAEEMSDVADRDSDVVLLAGPRDPPDASLDLRDLCEAGVDVTALNSGYSDSDAEPVAKCRVASTVGVAQGCLESTVRFAELEKRMAEARCRVAVEPHVHGAVE